MALDYTTLFGDLGKIIQRMNSYQTLGGTTLPADLSVLLTQFGVRWLPHEGIAATYEALRDQVVGWRGILASLADRRLTDAALVQAQIGLTPGASIEQTLAELVKRMRLDGKAVKASYCSAGAPSYQAGNAGDGKVWVTLVLDGYNAPLSGGVSDVAYNGQRSQLCVPSETMTLECVADSVTDGLSEGSEAFAWSGGPAYSDLDVRTEGSGYGPVVQVANVGQTLLSNPDYETWSSGAPSSWTVAAGTVTQETTIVHRGTSSLRMEGGSTVRVTQEIGSAGVQGKRRYHVGLALRASAVAVGAQFRAYLSGTNAPATGESLSVDAAAFPLTWSSEGFFINFPSPVPDDWTLTLEATGLPSGAYLYVGSASLVPAVYHGGVGLAVTGGASRWTRGDRVTFAVTNDQAGKFQDFFRRRYRMQLPSVNTASQGPLLSLLLTTMPWSVTECVLDRQVV